MKKLALVVLLAMMLGSTGCASVGTYFKDRALDFADCFKADVGYGYGLGAHVRLTELSSLGVGGGNMLKYGFKGRNVGTWKDIYLGHPLYNFFWAGEYKKSHPDEIHSGGEALLYLPTAIAFIGLKENSTSLTLNNYMGKDIHLEKEIINGGYVTRSFILINLLVSVSYTHLTLPTILRV